ncbi:carboxymuconolactone decarboxylase family protein [Salirhabdus salicampi]|uniref:carboxymuconolactone decarboxylase family protein n=1 Tax=Salirhabdus salicampi TaxID=476102 RepID=UPI0020C3D749|nr:carboxymuconolactone decarboxylase family protein [Salirhabdus salicampi]MCP8615740.1 carboxymuconolactone decarboxylase family protein [Salirhabdus salicampi]
MDTFPEEMDSFFEESIIDYKEGTNRIRERLPKMTQGYFDFTEACFQEGAIKEKEKQLMALAVSIYAQDEYCIMYHTKGAVEHGASEEEVMETVAVSAALGGGAAFSQGVTLALDTYDYYSGMTHH